MTNSLLEDNLSGVQATDCDVVVTQSSFKRNNVPYQYGGAALALGDGPIGLYRRWARQFYSDPA